VRERDHLRRRQVDVSDLPQCRLEDGHAVTELPNRLGGVGRALQNNLAQLAARPNSTEDDPADDVVLRH